MKLCLIDYMLCNLLINYNFFLDPGKHTHYIVCIVYDFAVVIACRIKMNILYAYTM